MPVVSAGMRDGWPSDGRNQPEMQMEMTRVRGRGCMDRGCCLQRWLRKSVSMFL